jgi:signal transduction histidine kinase/ActR/RegA family two-component response regulator
MHENSDKIRRPGLLTIERQPTRLAIALAVTVVYFLTGKLGLHFALVHPSASAIWAPSGISLAACLLFGYWIWPAIWSGAVLVNATTYGSFATSVGIAIGNTAEALTGAYLVKRCARGQDAFNRTADAFRFVLLAAGLSTTVSPTIGVTSLYTGGYAAWSKCLSIWLTWWIGAATGDLIVAPLLILWARSPRADWDPQKIAEAALLMGTLLLTADVVFGGLLPFWGPQYPSAFLFLPVLLWADFRFGPRGTSTVMFLLSMVAIAGTAHGLGPLSHSGRNEALMLVQAMTAVAGTSHLVVAIEVSQRRRLDKEREALLRSECAARDAAESARRAAETANRAKDEFLAMLGHELRNPLQAISLASQLLQSPQKIEKACEIITRQGGHMTRLVDDLLDAARVTSGRIVLRRRPLNLARLVSQCIVSLRDTEQFERHTVETDFETVWLAGDSERLSQIMINLLGNAVKYTPPGGKIRVTVKAGEDALIQVQDNGIGISADMLPHVFDLFARGEFGLQRSPAGLGIGLTLVKRIAELHGGLAEAASDGPGRGSVFTVRLPRIAAPDTRRPESDSELNKPIEPRRILLIEDNDDTRESLRVLLEASGHKVYEAFDGPAGVERALEAKPEVVLIDLGLPGLDGYEVAARIRAAPACRATRLIAVTGYTQNAHRERAQSAGFNGYLVKPVEITELEKLIATDPGTERI